MPRAKKETCDLCYDAIQKEQDSLKCKGDCSCVVHCYCAGVTRTYYDALCKSSSPVLLVENNQCGYPARRYSRWKLNLQQLKTYPWAILQGRYHRLPHRAMRQSLPLPQTCKMDIDIQGLGLSSVNLRSHPLLPLPALSEQPSHLQKLQ